jgi:hypothetical protein
MDGRLAIENNLQALKRILAGLVAMAGLGASPREDARQGKAEPPAHRNTLPRHLRLAILRLLRPAESAARRLIVAAARGLVVTLPPLRARKPKPAAADPVLRRFGIAVTLPPGAILPRSRGVSSRFAEGKSIVPVGRWKAGERRDAAQERGPGRPGTTARVLPLASPIMDSAGGGGSRGAISLPLFDPPRRFRRRIGRTVPAHAAPRILLPGIIAPHVLPPPPSRDDPIDATRLNLRLAALAAALDDIEGQAKRFARLQARRKQAPARRIWPLRPGRPPGGRLTRYDPSKLHGRRVREVDEILAHAHALALHALRPPDSS